MMQYLVCRTCGKHTPAPDVVGKAWCSEECTRVYTACVNCGKVFLRGKGFDGEHCSRACTVRYHILRKYGPQPVTVVTEV